MSHKIVCPVCRRGEIILKYEAKYVYSYKIDSDAPGVNNKDEFMSYLYDNREQTESVQYIECNVCKAKQPCVFSLKSGRIGYEQLKQSIDGLL